MSTANDEFRPLSSPSDCPRTTRHTQLLFPFSGLIFLSVITGEAARTRVHELRDRVDVVIVGANTVERDNPQLTTRLHKGRDSLRVVVDSGLKTSPRLRHFKPSELDGALKEAGFVPVERYGSFTRKAFDEAEDEQQVVIASRE